MQMSEEELKRQGAADRSALPSPEVLRSAGFPVGLLSAHLRVGLLNELEYRANFFVQVWQSLLELGAAIAGLLVVFRHTQTLGGWSRDELLGLLGIYFLMGGLISTLIRPSLERFMEDVRRGTLDFTLTKPRDAQLLVSIRQIRIWKLTDFLLGLGLVAYALIRVQANIGVGDAMVFMVTLLCGTAIVYSYWLMLATCTFWFVKIENILVIFQSMYEAGRWPIGIYPGWLQVLLTALVPVAFAVTVPAEALVGRLNTGMMIGAGVLAIVLLIVSRWFWLVGLRSYSGASA
ncbi:MAG: ABC-2 family transporter protein [Verrucomicrobiota bacterium]|jgi:ABC-2 type transport system permease protein|nr:ABC-2 family transporter protein [Verrucomicrobiota bacterium]MDD8050884.1 ABC-2 family transporter protein [Verrucomicrobiota bacterium]HCF94025.1 ABC transporter permease [Verrucomicrobiota bacterium]